MAARCSGRVPAETEVAIALPSDRGLLLGRVARTTPNDALAIAFRQDNTTLESVDQAMSSLRSLHAA